MKTKPACLFVFFLLLRGLAQAQESSPADAPLHGTKIEQEQESKASHLIPDKPSKAEREFTKVEYVLNTVLEAPPTGIRPKFSSNVPNWGGLVLGSGFSIGPEYYRPDLANGEMVLRASAIGTTRRNYLFDGQLTFPRAAGNRMIFDFLGRYKAERAIDYYGAGPDSQKGNRTDYSREIGEVNFLSGWKPIPRHLQLGVIAGFLQVQTSHGVASGITSTEQIFPSLAAPGIDRQTDFLRGGAYAEFDSTDQPNMPRKGTRLRVSYDAYHDRKLDAYSFRMVQGLIEQYIPFFNEKRVLALRAKTAISYANSNQTVPFYLQQTLGGPDDLRGYRLFRFTDNNNLVLNAEYRWEVAPSLDMALFADAGKVFHRSGELNLADLQSAGGFGFRFRSRASVIMRLDFGFSREGFQGWFRFTNVY